MIDIFMYFSSGLCAVFGVLVSVIWRQQNRRFEKIEKKLSAFSHVFSDIAEIKTDIKWIKDSLKE